MKYDIIIGLEVHLQLNTQTKIFCSCCNKFGLEPNTATCPVCLGLPGSLPVFNEAVLKSGIKLALALGCEIASFMKFDRKNYFYPDLPKNYQISQFDIPLAKGGSVTISDEKKIDLTRIHIEEDAGKLTHDLSDMSHVDFNRTGTPLLEIVTEPVIYSPEEAYAYLTELKTICQYLEISDCNMEEGSLRCDANVSLKKHGAAEFGTKTELKNMNSFRGVKQALTVEIERQQDILDEGGTIHQETRLYDDAKKKTVLMRTKEGASDYRYFPDPDLPPFDIHKEVIDSLKAEMPELRQDKMKRYLHDYALSPYDAGVLTQDKDVALCFEATVAEAAKSGLEETKKIANWFTGPILAYLNDKKTPISKTKYDINNFVSMLSMIEKGEVSNSAAKNDILPDLIEQGCNPSSIVKSKNLGQISDNSELLSQIQEVIAANEKSVQDFRNGKDNAVQFLIGQVMRKTRGKANPSALNTLIRQELSQ